MKYIITESQHKRLFEEEQKILHIPSLKIFDENILVAWNILQKFLEKKGNTPYTISGNLDLYGLPVKSLGNLQSVGGFFSLLRTPLSMMYTEEQIRQMVNVDGEIYF